jgi:hypothetical protein
MDKSTHLLRVSLRHVVPKVTRDLLVPSTLSLDRLHQVLQIAMGWENAHLHEFIVGSLRDGEHYGPPAPKSEFDFGGPPKRAEKRHTLQQIAPCKGNKFLYWYDFGDDWLHDVAVKAVGVSLPDIEAPHCLEGLGACPPEDCGGTPGYANLLEVLADPRHQDHAEILEWVGGGFDPAEFDIDAVNEELARVAKRWSRPSQRRRAPASSL